jgi:hypothetical protein
MSWTLTFYGNALVLSNSGFFSQHVTFPGEIVNIDISRHPFSSSFFLQNVAVMLHYQTYLVIPSVTWILPVPLLAVVHLWHSSEETSTFTLL